MKKILFFLILFFPVCVYAQLYQWVDENGVQHFSDSKADVPQQHQKTLPGQETGNTPERMNKPATGSDMAAEVKPYVLEGKIIDPNKILLQGSMDEGVKWDGVLNPTGLQVILIKAYRNRQMIQSVHPDSNGHYKITSDREIEGLYAYRDITGDEMRKNGPWKKDSRMDFIFFKGNVFTISGRVTDTYGQPVYGAFVFATDDMGSRLATTRTDRNGNYTLNLAKEAKALNAYSKPLRPKTTISGPWNADTSVDIQLRQ